MNTRFLLKTFLAVILILSFASFVPAQGTGGGIDVKIGFVNSLEILQGCSEGKVEIAKIDAYAQSKEKELKTISDELNTLRTNYQSQVNTLNPATANEMQATIQEKEKQLRRFTEDAEAELESKRAELFSAMGEKIREIITEYATANSIDIVFLESPGLPYRAEALNLTQEIIKAYDTRFPAN